MKLLPDIFFLGEILKLQFFLLFLHRIKNNKKYQNEKKTLFISVFCGQLASHQSSHKRKKIGTVPNSLQKKYIVVQTLHTTSVL